jgi:NAD(P)-dependent dehydrogenase (short-subunit alcohol dehydrogenase family)
MTAWLAGRTVRLVGDRPVIASALARHGARLAASNDEDCDGLIHVAQPNPATPAHQISHEVWRASLDAGLDSRFLLAQAFARRRRALRKPGAIVFVGEPEQALGADHAAAAGACANLVKTLGVEWARDGIRVNAVLTATDDDALGALVAYLTSDYAAYVTGAVMGVGLADV